MTEAHANPHHERRWLILAVLGLAQLMVVLDGLRTKREKPSKLHVEPMAEKDLDHAMRTWRPPGR